MGIYQRYASREHDEAFFNSSKRDQSINNSTNVSQSIPKSTDLTSIDIPPLSGQYDAEHKDNSHITTINDYVRMFPSAAFYVGHDKELFEDVIVMVYNHLKTNKISTKALTKFGLTSYDNMKLDPNSRFWPSCENLSEQSQQSPVKRALAITNLKNYNRLSNHSGSIELNRSWDETNAGSLAESMILLENKTPEEVGLKLTQIGLLQSHQLDSVLLDIVYDNSDQRAINNNNRLVFLIGEQLEQLFDPLLEYSPEAMQIEYIVPTTANYAPTKVNSHLIDSVVTELITVQANFTMGLVNLLQNFIIPLRISVLSSTANTGIAKLNQVFPPTIDEITRINCILHDALSKAHSYGYMEVMKVMNMILPYFYKPFIRHEANLRNFSSKIDRFNKKNRSNVFENDSINQGGYSYRGVESIVSGSLMELPRFKLILKRLQETIRSEKVILGVNSESDEEAKLFQTYFSRSIEVIDAFGGEENQLSIDPRQRIFTPTGKILTELASKWPSELQYGWLSRKVVGIFKLKNVKSEGIHDIEILIIFSDHLLFITIVDNSYYLRDGSSKNLSIPDILMHSLINEKPLPNLSLFPDMQVTNWCDINDVLVTSYKAVGSDGTESDLLRFLSKHQNGFNSTNQEERKFSKNFEVINTKRSELHNSTSILKLINKARVLLKSQPFHLFRSDTPNLSLYSTAHDVSVYEAETCKSPIALFLNMKIKDTEVYFTDHPYLDLIIHANLVTDGLVRIKAVDKFGIFKSRSTCEIQDFQKVIKEFVGNFYACVFKSSNSISNHAIEATGQDIKYVLDTFMNSDIEKLKEELREKQDRVKPIPLIERKTHKKTLSEALSIPESYLTKKVTNVTTNVQPEEKKLTIEKKEMKEEPLSKTQKAKRRRSFVQTIFQAFKRKNTGKVSPDVSQVKENGYIPQGEKKEYKKIYKPNPELQKASSVKVTKVAKEVPSQVKEPLKLEPVVINKAYVAPEAPKKIVTQEPASTKLLQSAVVLTKEVPAKEKAFGSHSNSIKSTSSNQFHRLSQIPVGNFKEEDFYADGETNWVPISFSREDSGVDPIKPPTSIDDVIHMNAIQNIKEPSPPPTPEDKSFEAYITVQDIPEVKSDPVPQPTAVIKQQEFVAPVEKFFKPQLRDISQQSLTPSEYATALSKQIDAKFSSSGRVPSFVYKPSTLSNSIQNIPKHNFSQITLTSSEDEFFSPDEFNNSMNSIIEHHNNNNSNTNSNNNNAAGFQNKITSIQTMTSSSSEGTIIIHDFQPQPPRSGFGEVSRDISIPSFITRDDSVAYLSEYLNQTLDFGDFSLQ